MKRLLVFLLPSLLALHLQGHEAVPLGPNGGRLLDFSKDKSLHAEVTRRNDEFHVALLDRNNQPVEIKGQKLQVTGGDRRKPEKPEVRVDGGHFVFKSLRGQEYPLVFQFKPSPAARAITAKFVYDAAICSGCSNPEWLCKCPPPDAAKAPTKK